MSGAWGRLGRGAWGQRGRRARIARVAVIPVEAASQPAKYAFMTTTVATGAAIAGSNGRRRRLGRVRGGRIRAREPGRCYEQKRSVHDSSSVGGCTLPGTAVGGGRQSATASPAARAFPNVTGFSGRAPRTHPAGRTALRRSYYLHIGRLAPGLELPCLKIAYHVLFPQRPHSSPLPQSAQIAP